jgi:hypothetical protein
MLVNGFPLALTTSGVWTNASDIRNKTNIKDIPYGLSTVMQLCPKNDLNLMNSCDWIYYKCKNYS